MHHMSVRMPPPLLSLSQAPRLPSLSVNDSLPSPPPSGLSTTYGSMPSLSVPTATTSDTTATSMPAFLPNTGAPSHTPPGITPAPNQPADSEATPAATLLQGVSTAMACMNPTPQAAMLDLSAMIRLTRRNLRR
ncbi:hypothetical protein L873DRAFT_733520 [Choiromyces venosus 120613-1]|uniref:Uncharacterized protein n=1 Tax=Choiromyces venosus 120613-1 TaxID=1336337 RepID=A0A3N4IWD1_9PEZI|nr:hypothetical protein L873DRAFT_733520 [Choiromyces venosus 120613-1]